MAEPDISPLARSLAEQNNVNWRTLAGSGPEGRITERDVFEYLARVAEGDAPVDPTPEPLPEGLESWPEEGGRAAQPAGASHDPSLDPSYDPDEDLLLADDDLIDYEPVQEEAAPEDDEFALDFESTPRDRAEPPRAADDEIFLFDEAPSPAAQASSQSSPDASSTVRAPERGFDDLDFGDPPATGVGEDELEGLEVASDTPYREPEDPHDPVELDFGDEAPESAPRPAQWQAPAGEDRYAFGAPASPRTPRAPDDERRGDASWASAAGSSAGPSTTGPSTTGPATTGPATTGSAGTAGDVDEPRDAREDWRAGQESNQEVDREVDVAPADEAAPVRRSEETAAPDGLPLMSHGLLLRSQVDLSPLQEARAAVGRSLGKNGEVAPTVFVLRAAAKVMEKSPLSEDGRVALGVVSRAGLGAAVMDGAAGMRFAELVEAVTDLADSRRTERDAAGLMVVDMSDYAVDEAVFSVGMPVLTLGRILVDSSDGDTYSTLSLSGDLEPVQAAEFLGRVAELLNSPIELLI